MIQGTSAMDQPVPQGRTLIRKLLWPGLFILLPLIGGAVLYPSISRWLGAERSVEISRIRIGDVTRGNLERDLSVQGRVVAAFHPTTFSPANGIVDLRVRAGDVVEEGQVLAVVDSPEVNSRLEQEESKLLSLQSQLERQRITAKQQRLSNRQAVDLAQVELEAARRAMDRSERIKAAGILNVVDYEEAQDNLRRAELALDHAKEVEALEAETLEFEIRNRELEVEHQRLIASEAQRQVDELSVRAPVAGLVSRLDVEDHDAVGPSQALVAVVDLSAFEIEVMIPENYADEIGPGTPAVIRYEGTQFAGEVKTVSPEVEGNQVKGHVNFVGEGPEGLRQNQRVSTRVILESKSDILKVARGPFLEEGGGHQAYVIDGDMAVLRPIEVGSLSVSEVEIVGGLQEGDRIIISDTTRFQNAKQVFLRQ